MNAPCPVVTFESLATFREVMDALGPDYILHYLGDGQYRMEKRAVRRPEVRNERRA